MALWDWLLHPLDYHSPHEQSYHIPPGHTIAGQHPVLADHFSFLDPVERLLHPVNSLANHYTGPPVTHYTESGRQGPGGPIPPPGGYARQPEGTGKYTGTPIAGGQAVGGTGQPVAPPPVASPGPSMPAGMGHLPGETYSTGYLGH